jgi:hypothetical protein
MSEPKDRFDVMLTDYQTLLPQMRDHFGHSNCPLTAEAVWKYFNTGKVTKARRALGSQAAVCSPSVRNRTTIESIKKLLKKHGQHGVLTVNAGADDEHSMNLVNIRGKVYMVDAYNERPVLTDQLKSYLGYARKLEFSWGWDVHIVPTDRIQTWNCP